MGERHGPSHIHNQLAVIITHTYTLILSLYLSQYLQGEGGRKREQLIVECHITGIIWFIPYKNPI